MIGLDTTAIIELFRGDDSLKDFLKENNEPLSLTILSYSELMFGLKDKIEEKFYDDFFTKIMGFDLDRISSKTASKIYRDARKKGFTIGQFDCLIAGIFLSNGVNKILTRNKKDFEKMKGITVVGY